MVHLYMLMMKKNNAPAKGVRLLAGLLEGGKEHVGLVGVHFRFMIFVGLMSARIVARLIRRHFRVHTAGLTGACIILDTRLAL